MTVALMSCLSFGEMMSLEVAGQPLGSRAVGDVEDLTRAE